ncbi:hypothetical protein [Lyngbya aestuarii]
MLALYFQIGWTIVNEIPYAVIWSSSPALSYTGLGLNIFSRYS